MPCFLPFQRNLNTLKKPISGTLPVTWSPKKLLEVIPIVWLDPGRRKKFRSLLSGLDNFHLPFLFLLQYRRISYGVPNLWPSSFNFEIVNSLASLFSPTSWETISRSNKCQNHGGVGDFRNPHCHYHSFLRLQSSFKLSPAPSLSPNSILTPSQHLDQFYSLPHSGKS